MTTRVCAHCRGPLEGQSSQRFCGYGCRQAALRRRKLGLPEDLPSQGFRPYALLELARQRSS